MNDDPFVTGRVINSTDELPSSTRSPIDVVREKIGPPTTGGFGEFPVDEGNGVTDADVRGDEWEGGDFSSKTSGRKNATVSFCRLTLLLSECKYVATDRMWQYNSSHNRCQVFTGTRRIQSV